MFSSTPSAAHREARHELDNLMEEAGDLVFRLDTDGLILFASKRAHTLFSAPSGLCGHLLLPLAAEASRAALQAALQDCLEEPGRLEVRLQTPDQEIWFELRLSSYMNADGIAELLVVGRDTSAQHNTEERLRHMATHDALTGLPNRLLLSDRIRMVIAQAARSGQSFYVATIGLDGFKKVNDGLG
ncbi:MAG: diguanylate cyclase, partial [Janthinobacterium lividum]|nr:diguanylate cyclase [Janthinobacterium lividum]